MLESECDFSIHVRSLGYLFLLLPPPKMVPKSHTFSIFSATLQLNGKFNNVLYLQNKT